MTTETATTLCPSPEKTDWRGVWVWPDDAPSARNVYALFRRAKAVDVDCDLAAKGMASETKPMLSTGLKSVASDVHYTVELARCFLRLANLPNYALDRVSRYEATLWRQVRQTLFALDALDRRKPQERRRRFDVAEPPGLLGFERDEY